MSQENHFRKVIAWAVLAALALALALQAWQARPELAKLRARETALTCRCDAACAADARRRLARADAGIAQCVEPAEAMLLVEELRRVRVRIAEMESLGW